MPQPSPTSTSSQPLAMQQLQALRKLLKNVADETSIEQVHRLRTTTRRVEAIFAVSQLEETKTLRHLLGTLKRLRKAAGGVRDLDVFVTIGAKLGEQFHGDALAELHGKLVAKRDREARSLARFVRKHEHAARRELKQQEKRIDQAVHLLSGVEDGERRARMIARGLDRLRKLGSWPELEAENLHAFRIQVKKLRYTLQLSSTADAELIRALGKTKDAIGDWHDHLELLRIAKKMMPHDENAEWMRYLRSTEQEKLHHALDVANKVRHVHVPRWKKKLPASARLDSSPAQEHEAVQSA